jgi:hypothetical protein
VAGSAAATGSAAGAVIDPAAPPAAMAEWGYADPAYAAALSEFGAPIRLPGSGGSLLVRAIPGTDAFDAMGPYPLFACSDWTALRDDLAALASRLVTATLVADPFGRHDPALLERTFDVVRPLKRHFIVDLAGARGASPSKHHRYYARRAMREVEIDIPADPGAYAGEWTALYGDLVSRHSIEGLRAFSRASFDAQLRVRGAVLFRALRHGTAVGAQIWYEGGERGTGSGPATGCAATTGSGPATAWSHLAASSAEGYELGAAYALHAAAIDHFRGRADLLDLGGGAGLDDDGGDGLTAFKAGWATGTRTTFLCGAVLQPGSCARLSAGASGTGYFPAYRAGEFAGRSR